MRYLIHEGGNALQLPWSTQTNGRVGNYRVNYAEHHKRRTLEIEKHIDTQSYDWNGFNFAVNGESDDKPLVLATNDELVTHIFGTGSLLEYVVFHVKRAGSGTIKPFFEQDDGTVLKILDQAGAELSIDLSKTGHYYGTVNGDTAAAAASGNTLQTITLEDFVVDGKTVSGVKAKIAVPAAATAAASVPYMTTDNGVLGFTFTAEKDDDSKDLPFDTCVGIYMAVKDFWDEHQCECAPAPCETEYPDPVCTPNKKPTTAPV